MNSALLLLILLFADDSLIADEYTENVPPMIAIGATGDDAARNMEQENRACIR